MKKTFLATTLLTIFCSNAFSQESKVICAKTEANSLNSAIKNAENEGFVIVSAPSSITSKGSTYALCVTVTKP